MMSTDGDYKSINKVLVQTNVNQISWNCYLFREVKIVRDEGKAKEQLLNNQKSCTGIEKMVSIKETEKHKQEDESLSKSEAQYQNLFEYARDVIFTVSAEGKITSLNPAFETVTGWSRDEWIDKSFAPLVHPDDLPRAMDIYRRAFSGEKMPTSEFRAVTKSGKYLTFEFILTPVVNNILLGIARNITGRKKMEEVLKQSEETYRTLVENLQDGLVVIQDAKIQFVNEVFAKMTNYGVKELLGKDFMELVSPKDAGMITEYYQRREARKNTPSEYEVRILSKDKNELIVNANVGFVTYNGKMAHMATLKDITERTKFQETLKQSEEEYRTLVENIQDGIIVIQDAKIQFASKTFVRAAGYIVGEVIGKHFMEFIAPEDLEKVAEYYHRRQAGEDVPREYEFRVLHKDGRTRILVNVNAGLITYHGRVASMVTVKNVTEKKKLEAQLLRAQRMESIGTLSGGIAHDLNNVLTPMMLSLQTLEEKFPDEQSQKLLTILERNLQRGVDLIKQVMSFARGIEGERKPLQVAHIISEVEKVAKETFPRNIEIKTNISKDRFSILGDATQLHQVIMNLCVNARDAMPDGGVLDISVENFYVDASYARANIESKVGQYIVITVSDTGTGISPEIMDRIFEPFFTTKEHGKGTGLGLSTALGIVRSHGGFIDVQSEAGKGTTFKVYLPAIKTETQKTEEHKLKLPAGGGELILIVEDEGLIREITCTALEAHSYKVLIAENGEQAIVLYAQNKDKIKVILMDLMMPVMDGEESIRAIRRINPEIKIIAVSGLAEKNKLKKVSDYTNAFLPKPYTAEKLLRTIHEVLSTK